MFIFCNFPLPCLDLMSSRFFYLKIFTFLFIKIFHKSKSSKENGFSIPE
jgi:hypothetical protein